MRCNALDNNINNVTFLYRFQTFISSKLFFNNVKYDK